MPVFEYKAISAKGKEIKGVIDSESIRLARQKLKIDGIFPTEIKESEDVAKKKGLSITKTWTFHRKTSVAKLAFATRQLATLVNAGMPLVETLKAVSEQTDDPILKSTFSRVSESVNEGATMANAMKEYPNVFPRLFTNMVASGEASGSLDLVLVRLADLLEGQALLRRKIISALTYPILMLMLCFAVVIFLLSYVVPQITAIFKEQQATLPLPTAIIISISQFLENWWLVLLLIILVLFFSVKRYIATETGRFHWDSLKLHIPISGSLVIKICTARFARNLGTLLGSGVELLQALTIVKNIVDNKVFERGIDSAIVGIREGKSLSNELKKHPEFPKMLIHITAIGEKSGQLEEMLTKVADTFEGEIDASLTSLTSILEPLIMLLIASIVGCILAAVMLPMLEMSSIGM